MERMRLPTSGQPAANPAPARDPGPALEGVDLEAARNPSRAPNLGTSGVRQAPRPRLERTESLAPITGEPVMTPGGLSVSEVDNPNFIEGVPIAQAEAKGAELVKKPKRPKCAGGVRRIPPCAWKVEQRGGYCINEQGVVTTQQGVTGVEIPATIMGRVVPYTVSARDPGCDPVSEAPESPPR